MYKPTDILKSVAPIHSSRTVLKDQSGTACWLVLVSFYEWLCTCGADECKLFESTKHLAVLHILWCKLQFFFLFCFPFRHLWWGLKIKISIDLYFIMYENSAESIKIDTDHKRQNFIEINQHCGGSCHLSFCSDAIFRTALLIPCKMILSKNSAARRSWSLAAY